MPFIGPVEDKPIHELVMVYGDAKIQMIGDQPGMKMQYGVFLIFRG